MLDSGVYDGEAILGVLHNIHDAVAPQTTKNRMTYLTVSNYWAHCWCCTDLDARSSKEPLAAAVVVDPGSAGCRAIGGVEGPEDWMGEVKDSEPVLVIELVPIDEETPGADAGAGVEDGAGGELVRAWDGVEGGG